MVRTGHAEDVTLEVKDVNVREADPQPSTGLGFVHLGDHKTKHAQKHSVSHALVLLMRLAFSRTAFSRTAFSRTRRQVCPPEW